jgi:hypothetical protein
MKPPVQLIYANSVIINVKCKKRIRQNVIYGLISLKSHVLIIALFIVMKA